MLAMLAVTAMANCSIVPISLKCERLENPIGIGTATPVFSWQLKASASERNLSQRAYRIRVGDGPGKSNLWDSGLVNSSETFDIRYAGKPLKSGQRAWWHLAVVDQSGEASQKVSGTFSVGLLDQSDWKAAWIGYDEPRDAARIADPFNEAKWIWGPGNTNCTLERKVVVGPGLRSAKISMTVDDQFVLLVNGTEAIRSSGQADAWRNWKSADLLPLLRQGENVIQVQARNSAGESGALINLDLGYTGKSESIKSDASWTVSGQPARVLKAYGEGPWNKLRQGLELPPTRLLRTEFKAPKPIKRATIYASALGMFDLSVNGKSVSEERFMPGWTDYKKRVYSRAYDVTRLVKAGGNALGVELADGWYSGYLGYSGTRDHYGSKTRAKVQLELEFTDGTKQTVASGSDWRAGTGATIEGDFLMGEAYDARLEPKGWNLPGFDDSAWAKVDVGAEMNPTLEPFPGQPVRRFALLKPVSIRKSGDDVYILDLNQNFAGVPRLKIKGKKGQRVVLRFAERLNTDGSFYTTNLRAARATDTYICKGEGVEVWEPKFTFHGFQYIEVTGLGKQPTPDEVVGIALSSDTEQVGSIETSAPMLNRLVKNAWWTQRANFIDIPTDCPQRDERLGWTGDAQAYIRTATYLADVHPFFTKWLVALDDAQRADGQYPMVAPLKVAGDDGGPAWDAAGVICPWTIYDIYGDKALLARHYPQMKKFIDFYVKRSKPDLSPPDQFHCFGDWLNINANTNPVVIYSAYFAGCARIVADSAKVLGKTADAKHYADLYRRVREKFMKDYVTVDGVVAGNTQCAYVLALAFDLLPTQNGVDKMAADRLVKDIESRGWHLSTGFVGTRDIMHVLSKIGRNDVAFRLLHNKTFPSWGFTIVNGATSIWERWDGWTPEKGFQDPGMNSFAHYAFGAVVGWMFEQPAGIKNLEPGFGHVSIAPQIDPNLTWLKSTYDSIRGQIRSEWKIVKGQLTLNVEVPPNVKADVWVPVKGKGLIGSIGVKESARNPNQVMFRVGSGKYQFTTGWK